MCRCVSSGLQCICLPNRDELGVTLIVCSSWWPYTPVAVPHVVFRQLSDSDVALAMTDIDGEQHEGGDRTIEFDEMIAWLERQELWNRDKAE